MTNYRVEADRKIGDGREGIYTRSASSAEGPTFHSMGTFIDIPNPHVPYIIHNLYEPEDGRL